MTTITTRAGKGAALTYSELDANFTRSSTAKTANYTIAASDNRDSVEFNGASLTATLPDAATTIAAVDTGDFEVTIVNTNASTLTVSPSGTDTIDGKATWSIGQNQSFTFKVDAAGTSWRVKHAGNAFPKGTVMVFYQSAAPLGWTQVTTQNDKALRVVSGSGGGVGGTHGLSSPPSTAHTHTGPSHTHTGPSHTHTYSGVVAHTHSFTTANAGGHTHNIVGSSSGTGVTAFSGPGGAGATGGSVNTDIVIAQTSGDHAHTGTTNSTGSASATTDAGGTGSTGAAGTGSTSSNGPTAFTPQYIDVIIASKD